MENVALIGIDLDKYSFHIYCQGKSSKTLLRKKFTRTKLMQFLSTCPSSVVVMKACAGAYFMARRISKRATKTYALIKHQYCENEGTIDFLYRLSAARPSLTNRESKKALRRIKAGELTRTLFVLHKG